MELTVLLAAEIDIRRAFNYYENQKDGLGLRFLTQLESCYDLIVQQPEIARLVTRRHRRYVMRKFPHGVFYVAYPTRVAILAVMDLRQNPEAILRRLRENE